jgi:transcriptional regulator NrdR family protein
MTCPNCGDRSAPQVIETRDTAKGNRRRRYLCGHCRQRFTTVEVVAQTDGSRTAIDTYAARLSA